MRQSGRLNGLLDQAARSHPAGSAVEDPDHGSVSYAALADSARAVTAMLQAASITAGDRVGILAPKSIGVVASIFGILGADAAYVPVDATGPLARAAYIFGNCSVSAMVVAPALFPGLCQEMPAFTCTQTGLVDIPGISGGPLILAAVAPLDRSARPPVPPAADLAYILYTSGSTGVPKGVMHSHASAFSFIDWCSGEFAPTAADRFSSHAPFHFDLSIFDLFVAVKHAATLVLIGEERGKQPLQLAALIADRRLTVWYSTPSILRLLIEYGKLTNHDCSALRLVLYAGEVFPTKHHRKLRGLWPHPAYYNLYGPTETNVCTYDHVEQVPVDDQATVLPIGRVCSGDEARVADDAGRPVAAGEEGELFVTGGSVMLDYWNLPEQNARAFHRDPDGTRWYRTGDVVVDSGDGYYLFLGRRDRMVKRRGYRVELGEIEAALHRHASITEAAVIAVPDAESGVIIKAFINWTAEPRPSLIELKSFAAANLPAYMVPDRFSILDTLPKTSTDKIDYQRLKEQA